MTPHERYTKRLDWFKSRIGKRVYRNAGDCDCPICMSVGIHGLFIVDDLHATYLRDCEADLELYYADTSMQVRWWLIKRLIKKLMKRLIYYSPYIPVIGLFTVVYFDTCVTDKRHYWYTLLVQSVVVGYLLQSII